MGEHGDRVIDRAEQFVRDLRRDILGLFEKRFAELGARLDVSLPEARSRLEKTFRFSSERDDGDVVDLSNPLVRKVTVN